MIMLHRFSLFRRSFVTENFLRNVAIIAHVDHGKTTLVDCLLKQSGSVDASAFSTRMMDSNTLEKERGITILSKCTSINYERYKINVVDTPGHADFGGEVERALSMVDGVILVVDASEGPMAQTKFVLSKALKKNLLPIVVMNKVDRPSARCDEVDSELLDLFSVLGANDEQMNYTTVFASAKEGWCSLVDPFEGDPSRSRKIEGDMSDLFKLIINKIPAPKGDPAEPFSMLVSSIEPNSYLGRCYLGRIFSGSVKLGDSIKGISEESTEACEGKVTKIFSRKGLEQMDMTEASAGDIVVLAGIPNLKPNFTICSPEVEAPLTPIYVDPPTVSMSFLVNKSPLNGSEGKSLTSQSLLERLRKESENNVAIQLKPTQNQDVIEVAGRGEMQLGIIIENMRREGLELAVSPPKVVMRKDASTNRILEPYEEVTVDCNAEYAGTVIEKLSRRKAELLRMSEVEGKSRIVFKCPMRGLIGYSSEFKNDTHGTGVINHSFIDYEPFCGEIETSRKGCLISMADGVASGYALADLESRGTLFIGPGTKVYSGMIIGEASREYDMEVNPCKTKVLTNMRSTGKDEFYRLIPPKLMSLEETISYVANDEIIEVTPKSIRLRKFELDSNARKNSKSKARMINF